jgi:hypothetical protein
LSVIAQKILSAIPSNGCMIPTGKRFGHTSPRVVSMERLPPQGLVEDEVLRLLSERHGAMRMSLLYELLARKFGLSRAERYGHPADPKGSCWEFLVRLARRDLEEAGLLHSPRAGCWAVTEAGRERAHALLRRRVGA